MAGILAFRQNTCSVTWPKPGLANTFYRPPGPARGFQKRSFSPLTPHQLMAKKKIALCEPIHKCFSHYLDRAARLSEAALPLGFRGGSSAVLVQTLAGTRR